MYDRRYAVEADMALMGSNRFKSGNKYFFSAAGGLAWILSNEDFLKDNELFSDLKVRFSYGTNGNLPGSYYANQALYAFSGGYDKCLLSLIIPFLSP